MPYKIISTRIAFESISCKKNYWLQNPVDISKLNEFLDILKKIFPFLNAPTKKTINGVTYQVRHNSFGVYDYAIESPESLREAKGIKMLDDRVTIFSAEERRSLAHVFGKLPLADIEIIIRELGENCLSAHHEKIVRSHRSNAEKEKICANCKKTHAVYIGFIDTASNELVFYITSNQKTRKESKLRIAHGLKKNFHMGKGIKKSGTGGSFNGLAIAKISAKNLNGTIEPTDDFSGSIIRIPVPENGN